MINPVFGHNFRLEIKTHKIVYGIVALLAIGLIALSTQNLPFDSFNGIGGLGSNIILGAGISLLVVALAKASLTAAKLSKPLDDLEVKALELSLGSNQYTWIVKKNDLNNCNLIVRYDELAFTNKYKKVKTSNKHIQGKQPLSIMNYKKALSLKNEVDKQTVTTKLTQNEVISYQPLLHWSESFWFLNENEEIFTASNKEIVEGQSLIEVSRGNVRQCVGENVPIEFLKIRKGPTL